MYSRIYFGLFLKYNFANLSVLPSDFSRGVYVCMYVVCVCTCKIVLSLVLVSTGCGLDEVVKSKEGG